MVEEEGGSAVISQWKGGVKDGRYGRASDVGLQAWRVLQEEGTGAANAVVSRRDTCHSRR